MLFLGIILLYYISRYLTSQITFDRSTVKRPIFSLRIQIEQSAAETARKINQAFGNNIVNERNVRRWFAKFRSEDFCLEDEPRSGRPTVIQNEDLRTLVETSPLQTVRGMAGELGFSSNAVLMV